MKEKQKKIDFIDDRPCATQSDKCDAQSEKERSSVFSHASHNCIGIDGELK